MSFPSRRIPARFWPLALALAAALAWGHGYTVGAIAVEHPFAAPSLPGTKNGAAYVAALQNSGASADRLVKATTPVAARVELHTMAVDAQGVMRMRETDAIPIAAKEKVEMKPGMGYHLMLIDLKQTLKAGDRFPMKLVFEKAGPVDVEVVVQERRAGNGDMSHMH